MAETIPNSFDFQKLVQAHKSNVVKHQGFVEKRAVEEKITTLETENTGLKTQVSELEKEKEECLKREVLARQKAEEHKQKSKEHKQQAEEAEKSRKKAELEAKINKPTGCLNNEGLRQYIKGLKDKPDAFPLDICAIDLDNLRKVNNKINHEAGNRYILSFVKFIKEECPDAILVRDNDKGDEFTFIRKCIEPEKSSEQKSKDLYSLLKIFNDKYKKENEKEKYQELKFTCGFSTAKSYEDFYDAKSNADQEERKNKKIKKNIFRRVFHKTSSLLDSVKTKNN